MRLNHKNAFITAAGQGIGHATVLAFLKEGADVVATDINLALLNNLKHKADELGYGARLHIKQLDVTSEAEIDRVLSEVKSKPFNVLFNCAGFVHSGTIEACSQQDWDFSWSLNVTSMYRLIRKLLPEMVAAGGGSIINMASVASSVKGVPGRFVYGTTKAAVIGLTKSVAADYVGTHVRCNAICPGTVESPSLQNRIEEQAEAQKVSVDDVRKAFYARQPMGRLGKVDEIAALAVYLASDESAFTTGALHIIDGGWVN